MADIVEARSAPDIEAGKTLFVEYADALGVDLCFQGFGEEIAGFPGAYASTGGCLLLARAPRWAAGAVGLRPLMGTACEMKRLYVRPRFRGTGLGRRLATAIVDKGRDLGYGVMRLDTLPHLAAALALYRDLGFTQIPAYNDNPLPGVMFFELRLDGDAAPAATAS